MANHFDILIVGSGAGGATLAQRLAPTGKKILILERGEHLPREAANWDPKTVFIDRKYRTKEKWYDKDGRPFIPNTHYWVGGNTTFYGAALMRLRKGDFEEIRHSGGVSPAWPISLADLAPYYAGDEPAYAYPPITHDPGIARLQTHFENQGWRPFHLPLGVGLDEAHPVTSACIRCKTCGGYPCLLKAKSDARTLAVEPLLGRPNVTLLTGRKVVRLETDPDGRINLDYTHNNLEGHERLVKTLHAALDGFTDHAHPFSQHRLELDSLLPLYGTAHQVGTTRFGTDAASSVLDVHCKAHEVDNLYVVDSSFFVSSGAVNPTLTIVANAMRVGDHLKARLG